MVNKSKTKVRDNRILIIHLLVCSLGQDLATDETIFANADWKYVRSDSVVRTEE